MNNIHDTNKKGQMDNDEFVERLDKVATGLGKLRSELYKATKPGADKAGRPDVIKRAKTRLKEYEEFLPILSPGRREATIRMCDDDITGIRDYVKTLEELK